MGTPGALLLFRVITWLCCACSLLFVALPAPAGELINLSTRSLVETGDEVQIGGFVIAGGPTRVLIRAVGPSLAEFGVAGVLPDPTLELITLPTRDLINSNDNWQTSPDAAEIAAESTDRNLTPLDQLESAILTTLNPGAYTAIVSGVGGTTGIALVEIYLLAGTPDSGPELDVNPPALNFGLVAAGGSADRPFTVSNIGSSTLTVTSISIGPNPPEASQYFSILSSPPSPFNLESGGPPQDVTVRFQPSPSSSDSDVVSDTVNLAGDVEVSYNDGTRRVPVAGNFQDQVPSPDASAPDSVGFDDPVVVGDTGVEPLTVRNGSRYAPLTFSFSTDPPFSVSPPSVTVPPLGEGMVTVSFTPTMPGDFTEILTVTISSDNNDSTAVTLSGTAIEGDAFGCGNGVLDEGEQCDDQDLAGQSCETLELGTGTLSCAADCTFDTSGCTNPPLCGNGVLDEGEQCDPPGVSGTCDVGLECDNQCQCSPPVVQ